MKNLVFIPPVLPGQSPWYYAICGFILSLMVIILSIPSTISPQKKDKILYFVGCFLAVCVGVCCGYIIHILAAIIVGIILIAISIFVYIREVQ